MAVDLAKSVFQIAVADEHWRIVETQNPGVLRFRFESALHNDQSLRINDLRGPAAAIDLPDFIG